MQAKFEACWKVTLTIGERTGWFLVRVEELDRCKKLFLDMVEELERITPKEEKPGE